ncbi:uncharacterized protein DSM5745_07515 [Aspergillus mulundensis]|uniref:Uncharacterized protein n=1 Tax=Aspergillus mulundensis TaxID=1810919 RepID=A0A3D8RE46_9EURO|nr:hypothetical protein DSM5745_07515 [Aspergillus mulundensis]RDW72343.1 hypothetical protein DSM5745_07515 [Aspergillus mulundensis]
MASDADADWTSRTTTLPGVATDTTVVALDPPNTSTAASTWFIHSGTTSVLYTTWRDNAATTVSTSWTPAQEAATDEQSPSPSSTSSSRTSTSTSSIDESPGTPTITPTPSSPSSNSTSTQSHQANSGSSNSKSSGYSTGTLAGAIVGSIIGTALLTLFLAFLFFRRRRRTDASQPDHNPGVQYDKAGTAISESGTGAGAGAVFSLASVTPQPADDETVRRRILTLIDQADLHVDNYYVPASSSTLPHLTQADIAKLEKYNSEYLPDSVVDLLQKRTVQRQVVTHVLVYTLLKAIGPGGTLLPALLAAQPQVETGTTSNELPTYLFAWRMLTAHLYTNSKGSARPPPTSPHAGDLAAQFTSAFAPYAVSVPEPDRLAHLENLATATAELGTWLFAQPCTFRMDWERRARGFSVSPGVVKIADETGRSLLEPQVLVEEVEARF